MMKNEKKKFCIQWLWLVSIILLATGNLKAMDEKYLNSAHVRDIQTINVKLNKHLKQSQLDSVRVVPELNIVSRKSFDHTLEVTTEGIDFSNSYTITFGEEQIPVSTDAVLDSFYSDKALGCTWNDTQTFFRVFAPRAKFVKLILFDSIEDDTGQTFDMQRDPDGVWEFVLDGHAFGKYYAYSVDGPRGPSEQFDPEKLVADPYAKAVATRNEYLHRGKTLILDTSQYDWEGDAPLGYNMEDLIIYECHVRDLTAHPSSGVDPEWSGSYKGLLQKDIRGGIEHIKSLGVNAVQFLPIHDFGNIEIPYNEPVNGITNTWNPYARNHWGYMTSYFFAPESYYGSGESLEAEYCGVDGRQVDEFKDVVKAFHKEGIAVLLDVVYNHVAQYDQNCFKLIDKKYYFRLNENFIYTSLSGCGNDFRTERPMTRRLILDSVKFWMQEYHIDGFRFDLAALIDWETCEEIIHEARKINPNVIIIAEPWGGGYAPAEFSQRGWAAWNDQIRNGVKGQNPHDGHGFIFGRWFDYNSLDTMKRYVLGNLVEDGGLFQEPSHSVNYLESHDDHTLGDFIRIGLGGSEKVDDVDANARLNKQQLKLNKLAALFLFTSQGPIMIHEGQEWARSKVIAPTPVPDEHVGHIDHNSYNKDNETNWMNFEHADMNQELMDYYKGLIAMRKQHPVFRYSSKENIEFFDAPHNHYAFGFLLKKADTGDTHDMLVLLNGNRHVSAEFDLPEGEWVEIVNDKMAGLEPLGKRRNKIKLAPSTGVVLQQ